MGKGALRGAWPGNDGQTNIQLILPLLILLSVLVLFAMIIPTLSATKTIALAAGLVIFILCFVSTEIGLYVLILSMLLSPEFIVGSTAGASMGRGVTLRLDDFILVIIGFSWLAKMAINKDLGLFLRTPLNKPIAFYIVICLVSTLLGSLFGRVHLKTGFFFVLKYFEYIIVFFMVVNHIRDKSQARRYLWAMLFTCVLVSIIGIAQIPGGGRVSAPFEGEIGEPNTFGGYLVFMISLVTGLLITTRVLRDKFIYLSLLILFAVPLLYTQSRSSYVAAIPALLMFVFLSEKKHWIILGILVVAFTLPFFAPRVTKERVKYTFTQGLKRKDVVKVGGVKLDTSTSARLISWRDAISDSIKHPLLGFGVTGYRFVDAQYIRVIAETGVMGLLTFLLLMHAIFKQGWVSYQASKEPLEKGLSTGFLAGLIGLLFHAFGANTFIIVRIMEPFWFTAALVTMLPRLPEKA
ncbi:MAG: O-antigen ligase family protein [Deltaproteobacteria bacterium]|nr:O-antigen ligase family protein [Deltaproteobacteria bacterium]MBW2063811.1 O-antigen ligase family protein [Deltaproteobacteria bacterium]